MNIERPGWAVLASDKPIAAALRAAFPPPDSTPAPLLVMLDVIRRTKGGRRALLKRQ